MPCADENHKIKVCTEIVHTMLNCINKNDSDECVELAVAWILYYDNVYHMIYPEFHARFAIVLSETRASPGTDDVSSMIAYICSKDDTYIATLQHLICKGYNIEINTEMSAIIRKKNTEAAHNFFSTLVGG